MGDFATLRFGPKNASRRVVFGHGVGGLDKFANTFIKGAVEHWSTDPRLRHVEFILPTAPTRDMSMFAAGATADVREMLGDAKLPAWFDAGQDASLPNGWRLNREHIAESTTRWGPRRAWASSSRRCISWGGAVINLDLQGQEAQAINVAGSSAPPNGSRKLMPSILQAAR